MFAVALLVLLCADFALPMTPGAYRPLDLEAQSVLGARLSVQAAPAIPWPTLQPRPSSSKARSFLAVMDAPHPSPHLERHESPATPARPFAVPLGRTQLAAEAAAPTSEDPA
jgi:hypothetical protein